MIAQGLLRKMKGSPGRGCSMISDDEVPRLLGRFGEVKQRQIVRSDQPFFDQKRPVDETFPKRLSDENDGDVAGFARLKKGQRLEQFVERAEAPRERHQRPRAEQEMHLAQGEITKLETEIRGDVGIGALFVGQRNVEPHGFRARVRRATIGGLHDAWPSSGHDDIFALSIELAGGGDKMAELPGNVIITSQGQPTFCYRKALLQPSILRASLPCSPGVLQGLAGDRRLNESRASEYHDGRADSLLGLNEFRLEQFQPQTHGA